MKMMQRTRARMINYWYLSLRYSWILTRTCPCCIHIFKQAESSVHTNYLITLDCWPSIVLIFMFLLYARTLSLGLSPGWLTSGTLVYRRLEASYGLFFVITLSLYSDFLGVISLLCYTIIITIGTRTFSINSLIVSKGYQELRPQGISF